MLGYVRILTCPIATAMPGSPHPVEMGALIGIAIQLIFLAISLMITLVVWMARLMIMLVAALMAAISSRRP